MSRVNFNDGQEIVHGDLQKIAQHSEREIYDRVVYEMLQRNTDAFFADSLKVNYVGSTTASVNAGVGFQNDGTQVSPEPTKRMIYNAASVNKTLSAPDGVNDRIDIIVVKAARVASLNEMRKYKATIVASPTTVAFDTETDWAADIQVVAGTPSLTPAVPATPSGYIKLAELLVHAVTGLGGSVDVTDKRTLMPVGGNSTLNTLGYVRLTAGAAVALSTLMAEIDNFLKFGYFNYYDLDDLGADPAAPGASKKRIYFKSGVAYVRDSGGISPFGGGGGGGGGGANWSPEPGNGPSEDIENGEKVWKFEAGLGQKLVLFVKVPQSYLAGRQIKMYIAEYSPSTSNTILLNAVTYLVRKNNDAASSTANSHSSGNSALTNTVANQYRETTLELTNATGQVNSFSVSPGDLLRVELVRGTDTDTADIRFVPSGTEVTFT